MNPQLNSFQKLKQLGNITQPWGGTTRYEKFHPGIDVANKEGTPIPAMVGGTVVTADLGHAKGENNYGNSVIIKDEKGNLHRYSHLKRAFVKAGQRVGNSQQIGEMGSTGSAYSPDGGDATHLDYRVQNAYGKYINPGK